MAAIFNLSVTRMSESVHTVYDAWLDPENVGAAFGTLLLSCIEAEMLRYFICTSGIGGRLQFLVTRMSESVHTISAVLLEPENVGVAYGSSLLSCIEAEI